MVPAGHPLAGRHAGHPGGRVRAPDRLPAGRNRDPDGVRRRLRGARHSPEHRAAGRGARGGRRPRRPRARCRHPERPPHSLSHLSVFKMQGLLSVTMQHLYQLEN